MITENTTGVKSLLRNINKQAELAIKTQELVCKQNDLETKILGDLVPDWKNGKDDLREELAMSVVDGNEMTMEQLLNLLNRAKEQLEEENDPIQT